MHLIKNKKQKQKHWKKKKLCITKADLSLDDERDRCLPKGGKNKMMTKIVICKINKKQKNGCKNILLSFGSRWN